MHLQPEAYVAVTEQELVEREVLAELEAGNWPVCEMCHRIHYVGMVNSIPSFVCMRCRTFFGLDLVDAEGGDD